VGIANPTGVALIAVLTVMVVCSMPIVRKSGHFEIFYFSHLGSIPQNFIRQKSFQINMHLLILDKVPPKKLV
jgi:hypothetical protein